MNIEKPLEELSESKILILSFKVYSAKFFQFFIPFIVAGLVSGIFMLMAIGYLFPLLPSIPELVVSPENFLQWYFKFIAFLFAIVILISVISRIAATIAEGIVVKCTLDLIERGDVNLKQAFNFTLSRFASLLVAGIITSILTTVGFIFFIVPGIMLTIMFSLVVPVIMVEQKDGLKSLGRSRKLVMNRWGKAIVLLLAIGLVILSASLVALLISSIFGYNPFSYALSDYGSLFLQA